MRHKLNSWLSGYTSLIFPKNTDGSDSGVLLLGGIKGCEVNTSPNIYRKPPQEIDLFPLVIGVWLSGVWFGGVGRWAALTSYLTRYKLLISAFFYL